MFDGFCLHLGDAFSAHTGEILTFPLVEKRACLGHEPFLFWTPEAIFKRLIAALSG